MSIRASILPVEVHNSFPWSRCLLDSLLALAGVLVVTGGMTLFDLYPRIPTVPLTYLLVVLALAILRGRTAAILASLLAFCFYDFFLVPPLHTFVVGKLDDLVALVVFLATAIITGQLASALGHRAEQASRREQETRILYELGQAVNREDDLNAQLLTVARAVVDIFSSWQVQDCALLLPNAHGILEVQASAKAPLDQVRLSQDEQSAAAWVMQHCQTVDVYDGGSAAHHTVPPVPRLVVRSTAALRVVTQFVRLVPLLSKQECLGVMRLLIEGGAAQHNAKGMLGIDRNQLGPSTTFFWTFVDQATLLIERMRLHSARLHILALQETDALRAALLSSVSHDLRTPLATMKAATSSLLSEDMHWDEETRRSFLLSIEREIDRLNRLVSNLLDLSRIEGKALTPEKEWYLIDELVHDVVDRLRLLLQDRPVRLQLPEDLPPVELDYLAIDQVLTNLIENAVAYTPAGSPIDICTQIKDDHIRICVADRGPGIPPADLERVFDKFYRVQGTDRNKRPSPGSGLGLAVCRGLVEAHCGSIWAENRIGGGVVFSVSLPVGTKKSVPEQRKDVTE
jgi:two-component system sensor histidine kinase KdpD